MKRHSIALVTVLLLTSVALSQVSTAEEAAAAGQSTQPVSTPTDPAVGQTATANSDDDKVECRRSEEATGSRIGTKRECKTMREWREIKEAEEKSDKFRAGNSQGRSSSGGTN